MLYSMILESSNENQDVCVQFMKQSNLYLYWYEDNNQNQCWVPLQQALEFQMAMS